MNDESSFKTGAAVTKILESKGFGKIGTAAYESEDVPLQTAVDGIKEALDKIVEAPGGGSLDHLWIYVDTPEPKTLTSGLEDV